MAEQIILGSIITTEKTCQSQPRANSFSPQTPCNSKEWNFLFSFFSPSQPGQTWAYFIVPIAGAQDREENEEIQAQTEIYVRM